MDFVAVISVAAVFSVVADSVVVVFTADLVVEEVSTEVEEAAEEDADDAFPKL